MKTTPSPTSESKNPYSPEYVRAIAADLGNGDAIVDFTQFPIPLYMIDEMIGSLWKVNDIVASSDAYGITREELELLMQFVRAHNSPDGMMDSEQILSQSQKLWLHFYMDIKGLRVADESSFPDTAQAVAWLVDARHETQWQKVRSQLQAEWIMRK